MARAWSLISWSILLIFAHGEKVLILYRGERSWHRAIGGGGGALSHVMR